MLILVASNQCDLLRSWFDCLLMHVTSRPCSCSQIRCCHLSVQTGAAIGKVMFLHSQHYTNDEIIPRHPSSKVSAVNSGQFWGKECQCITSPSPRLESQGHLWFILLLLWPRHSHRKFTLFRLKSRNTEVISCNGFTYLLRWLLLVT